MTNPTMAIFASMIAEAEANMQRLETLIAANPSCETARQEQIEKAGVERELLLLIEVYTGR